MKYIIFLLFLIGVLLSCSMKQQPDLIGPIFSSYKKQIEKSRGYIVFGTGASMPDCEVKYLFMAFRGKEKVDLSEARRRYIELVEGLVDTINADLTIRPYLETYPATWRNTQVQLDFMRKEINKENISFISHVNERIYYRIEDRKNHFVSVYDESYEEALEIVKNEKLMNEQ